MLVERSCHPQFLSNTFLVADGEGGPAFFIDAGGPVAPLIAAAERLGLEPTHVLLTHHHFDHVSDVGELLERWPKLKVLISERERELLRATAANGGDESASSVGDGWGSIEAGETLSFGALDVRPLHTPGHTAGMLSFVVGERSRAAGGEGAPVRTVKSGAPGGLTGAGLAVFTGDTLFKNSVGGVKAPGHTTYTDLRDSIMGTLMELPPDTIIYPGHSEETSVGREWDTNAFIRVWRGLDPEGSQPCTALGQPATLVLLGADYDGGTKAWVRWRDGSDDIVPGSRVEQSS
ncbi:MAG: MBL fold metallo-hydrolase [Solirubrobacteraceae bacterium]|jgi:glyoxylase-like metal-dependent hydrolase (beta-lactamase superfamily II)